MPQVAIDKFEAVLEEEPGMVPAMYRSARAMQGLAACSSTPARQASTLLVDAANYLRDVMSSEAPDAAGLKPAAAEALDDCQRQMAALKS